MDTGDPKYTALFFGSFDPVHIGHLIIAEWFINQDNIAEVWFVVSPVNPFKRDIQQTQADVRLKMLSLAIEETKGFGICDIELNMPPPHYTYSTLLELKSRFPEKKFLLVIGGDNMVQFEKWRNHNKILEMVPVYVYPRTGSAIDSKHLLPNMTIANAPLIEISSTLIRKNLADGLSVRFMLSPKVYDFIIERGVYASPNSFSKVSE